MPFQSKLELPHSYRRKGGNPAVILDWTADSTMTNDTHTIDRPRQAPSVRTVWLLFAAIFATVYFASLFSPPLLDDVDAAHAQAAQHMAESGDLITSKINGIRYIEKPPLPYWLVAGMYKIFGAEHLCHAPAQRAGHAGADVAGVAVGAARVGRRARASMPGWACSLRSGRFCLRASSFPRRFWRFFC